MKGTDFALLKLKGTVSSSNSTTYKDSWFLCTVDIETYQWYRPTWHWTFSFNTGMLTLRCDEIVDLAFFNYSKITTMSTKVLDPSSPNIYKVIAPSMGRLLRRMRAMWIYRCHSINWTYWNINLTTWSHHHSHIWYLRKEPVLISHWHRICINA